MLDDGSEVLENSEELDSGDTVVDFVSIEPDASGDELLTSGDTGSGSSGNQTITLATIQDLNLNQYAFSGMAAVGAGCIVSIGVLVCLRILRTG